jgi:glycosyltransferase involved in cell wall biosynthesis
MRFIIHTPYYPPEMGAPQARLSSLALWLGGHGHDVWVLTAMPNYPRGRIFPGYRGLLRREKRDGVSIVRSCIYPTNSKNVFRRILSYLSFLVSSLIAGALFLPRADYVFTETPPPFLGVAGWLLAKMKGSRWIFNVSDLWVESMRDFGFIGKGWAYLALRSMVRFFYKRAWLVTGQSREVIAEIRSQWPSARVYHLSNGADPRSFHPEKRDEEIRAKYLKPGETGFVYAGLHGFFQGLDQVLQVAARFERDHFRFLFFGEGPEKEHLVKLARELNISNVDFHPAVPHQEIPPILASLDVAVVPLKKEIRGSVPSKIYEAMSSGVPVLLVGNGEAGKIIRDAEAGIAVNPGNREDLARSISEIAADPARRRRMGQGGRHAVETLYSRWEIARRFEAILLRSSPSGFAVRPPKADSRSVLL